jgi:hypothetical protein
MEERLLNILVENESSYRHFVETAPKAEPRRWYTTSPWLLERLPMLGEEVRSLEEGMTQEEINELGLFCKALSRRIVVELDEQIGTLAHGIRLGSVLLVRIRRGLFPLLYKGVLLERWINTLLASGHRGVVVGSTAHGSRGLSHSRFGTFYAVLAGRYDLPQGVQIVESPAAEGDKATERIKRLGTSGAERLLSLLNYNPELLVFKLWKRLLRSRPVSLAGGKAAPTIALLEDCELTEETVMHLLWKGCEIRKFRRLGRGREGKDWAGVPVISPEDLWDIVSAEMQGLPSVATRIGASGLPVMKVFSELLGQEVVFCLKTLEGLEHHHEEILKTEKGRGDRALGILSNGLFSPGDRMMYSFARSEGVPVFVCEHGITSGLSSMTAYLQDEDPLRLSDAVFCYNEVSREYHEGNTNARPKCVVTGMPKVNRGVQMRKAQRILARRMLGLPLRDRVIVFVSNLQFNNFVYSPGSCSDTFYHRFKRRVVYDILGRLQDPCLLKLYPTLRYPDPDPFAGLMDLPLNLRFAQFFEYRYLRAVGDVILCDSPQSTLGWVWSAGVPLIFLDLPSNPLVGHVAKAFDEAIFRVDCSEEGWVEKVRGLLEKPHQELLALWREKRTARLRATERYITGPAGNAGKTAARFIVEEMKTRPHLVGQDVSEATGLRESRPDP